MNGDEYERGIQDQRLRGHDEYLDRINSSQQKTIEELRSLRQEFNAIRMDLQRLIDAVESNQQTVATTATAVEAERKSTAEAVETQRTTIRDSTEKRWAPLARMVGAISLVGGIAGLIAWLISHLHN